MKSHCRSGRSSPSGTSPAPESLSLASGITLAPSLADRAAEGLGGAHSSSALLALDREDRAEAGAAFRAPGAHRAATRGTGGRQVGRVLLEVALRVPARE